MPTLLEKPTSSPAQLPTQVLQSRHRWERWRGVLIAGLTGLVITLAGVAFFHDEGLKVLAAIWLGGLILTAVAAAVAWKLAPTSLTDTAQGIDRNLAAKNRLEAMASLQGSATPLATAQREETADYLRQQPMARPVRILPWLVGGVIALALAHFILAAIWAIPALFRPSTPVPPPAPKDPPRATIIWKSPAPEIKANPVEEVPTVAIAESTSGLKNITLEISINGAPKKSQPIPAQPYEKAGKNTIKVSLYMDELGVEPFDMVSYYLRGQRITDQKVPDTASAIQFIQVRPFRDDVGVSNMPIPPGDAKDLDLIIKLKLAQLKAMKENFILAHTDLAVTDPVRMKENDRVGKNQGELAGKTDEVIQFFTEAGAPANIIDLLRQAQPLMTEASKNILANKNAEALPPQGKALDLIIQIEKFIEKKLNLKPPPGQSPPPPPDPFKDKQQFELKDRAKGAAGQLETLAKKQTDLAKDVEKPADSQSSSPSGDSPANGKPDAQDQSGSQDKPKDQGSQSNPSPGADASQGQGNSPQAPGAHPDNSGNPAPSPTPQSVDPFTPGADKGTLAERQARILQGVETLLSTNDVLPPTVGQALQDAKKHATESVHQLDQANANAAREPAAAAAQDLQRAVKELNKAGEAATKAAMAQAQQKLNDAAQELNDIAKNNPPGSNPDGISDVAAKVQDAQKQAGDAAAQQQDAGSAVGAKRLADLANQINNQNIPKDLANIPKKGLDVNQAGILVDKLHSLANQAAHGMNGEKPTAQEIAQMISSLEASRANLARLSEKAGGGGSHPPTPDQHGPGQNPQTGKDSGQGQQPGKDQGQNPGQGQGQQPGKDQGADQGQGQGQQPGKEPGQGQGEAPGDQPGGTAPGGTMPGGNAPGGSGDSGAAGGLTTTDNKAFRETLANVQDQVQQVSTLVPPAEAQDIQAKLNELQNHNGQKVPPANMVHAYRIIAPPLEKLIRDLTLMVGQAQREDLLRQPDLDEAPPSYRPAVSDYFENMSKDYHPESTGEDARKP